MIGRCRFSVEYHRPRIDPQRCTCAVQGSRTALRGQEFNGLDTQHSGATADHSLIAGLVTFPGMAGIGATLSAPCVTAKVRNPPDAVDRWRCRQGRLWDKSGR